MESIGFFSQLFQQFVAVLSALSIVPGGPVRAEVVTAIDTGPPAVVVEAADPTVQLRREREPYLMRVVQTQIRGAVVVGDATARAADDVTFAILAVPHTVARVIDRGGVAALPVGIAAAATGVVDGAERGSLRMVAALADLLRAELALLPGADVRGPERLLQLRDTESLFDPTRLEGQPWPVRLVATQVDGAMAIGKALVIGVVDVGAALLAAPRVVVAAVEQGGLSALPAGLAAAGVQLVSAAEDGVVRAIRTVADVARAEIDLIPGASEIRRMAIGDGRPMGLVAQAVDYALRFPIAVAVAASDLTRAAMSATTEVTGAVATAIIDVADAVNDPRSEMTVAEAIAQAPATINDGVKEAGRELSDGVQRAATNFRDTLTPNKRAERQEASVRASGGSGTAVRTGDTNDTGTDATTTGEPSGDGTVGDDGDVPLVESPDANDADVATEIDDADVQDTDVDDADAEDASVDAGADAGSEREAQAAA